MFSQLTCSAQLKTAWKSELSYKNRCFSFVCNYLRPSNNYRQLIFKIKCVVLIVIFFLKFTKMVKRLPAFEYFTVFLKNRNFISKLRRSKVTDYAALNRTIYTSLKGATSYIKAA